MRKHEQWSRRWQPADLESARLGCAYLCGAPSVRERVAQQLALPVIDSLETLPPDAATLLVTGGGTAMDRAKHFRATRRPAMQLIAIASLWGSGAEVSPIAVLNGERKDIHFGENFIPDYHVVWPELAQSASPDRLRFACGDVWAHALESFCSPLATDGIRRQSAELMNEMAAYPRAFDPRWFDASAAACLLQARSSVGLIHGFAHVLEPLLRAADPTGDWGHAKLCSTFLLPLMTFNLERSPRLEKFAAEYGLNLAAVQAVARALFVEPDYLAAMSVAGPQWETIVRDRCSRTNCVLVRRESLAFFQRFLAPGVPA